MCEGVNYPMMHPRCRCTTTVDVSWLSRRARDPLTGQNGIIDGNMNYEQWVDSLSDEQREAMALHVKEFKNLAADRQQFAIIAKSSAKIYRNHLTNSVN